MIYGKMTPKKLEAYISIYNCSRELAVAAAESAASRRAHPVCPERVKRAGIDTMEKSLRVTAAIMIMIELITGG